MSIKSEVLAQIEMVAREQKRPRMTLTDDLSLETSGLDSLCIAIVVARLEDRLGVDPFSSREAFEFPVTLGDFVRLYEQAAREPTLAS
jgi:acyl carrier protein